MDDYNITIQTLVINHGQKTALSAKKRTVSLYNILKKNIIKQKQSIKLCLTR